MVLTYSQKILQNHLYNKIESLPESGEYANFRPDRVAMQDATAQMALLQFMNAGMDKVKVPASIHCDHLIQAKDGVDRDLVRALEENREVYDFLQSAASKYGIDFWKPGYGIIHQTILENYALPGQMIVGTDSHTPNAGGMGMIAIGVGGADAVDVLTGQPWELKVPEIIGVHLTGELSEWASPKDVILTLANILTVKGATNCIIEYFGHGCETITCTGKATICNMGAELGATCSIFPVDQMTIRYLMKTNRQKEAYYIMANIDKYTADNEVLLAPNEYFDKVIEIDLSSIELRINGPFSPDISHTLDDIKEFCKENDYPTDIDVCLIGSCTNSSYQNLSNVAKIIEQAKSLGLEPKCKLIVNPGSEKIRKTAERDGILASIESVGGIIMANACGPCIGQWCRYTNDPNKKNTIVTTFNRNFAKRADGNPNTHAFIVSPELAAAFVFSGTFEIPKELKSVWSDDIPEHEFENFNGGCIKPVGNTEVIIDPYSERLQKLEPFKSWDGNDFENIPLLIKVKGKCTTDHISMAGPWLKYRGHLENISKNLLMGAIDAFTGNTSNISDKAKELGHSIIIAEENYGEGSSREHAAMEPRFMGVKCILVKSFARIHETNLKKQGILALTFNDPNDYDKILEGDLFDIKCSNISPNSNIEITIKHLNGESDTIIAKHTYNEQQIRWFKDGSALNTLNNNK